MARFRKISSKSPPSHFKLLKIPSEVKKNEAGLWKLSPDFQKSNLTLKILDCSLKTFASLRWHLSTRVEVGGQFEFMVPLLVDHKLVD